MDQLVSDVRYGWRRLLSTPAFTITAIISLALGIGANTAIFSVINAVLLRDLPVGELEQMADVYLSDSDGFRYATFSYPDYEDLRQEPAFRDALAYNPMLLALTEAGRSEMVWGELVSANYFSALGVRPAHGRGFLPEEGDVNAPVAVAVLGHGFWTRRYGGDPTVLGRTILLNGTPMQVVGIGPRDFNGLFPVVQSDYWVPLAAAGLLHMGSERTDARDSRSIFVKARLPATVSMAQAQAVATSLATRLGEAYPESNLGREITVVPTADVGLNPQVDRVLTPVAVLLLVLVGLVLVVAATNIATLLLVRSTARRREIATRLALGATRARLIRQLLTESVLLSLGGGLLGVGVAYLAVDALMNFTPPIPIPIRLDVAPDLKVLGYALLMTVGTGLLFGLAPALQSTRKGVLAAMKLDATVEDRGGRFRLRNLLVVGQVTASLVLLLAAGLFLRSLDKARRIEPGFETERLAMVMLTLQQFGYDNERAGVLMDEITRRASALPGVRAVMQTDRVPLGFTVMTRGLQLESEAPPGPGESLPEVDFANISADYFEVMGIPIVTGRAFSTSDRDDSAPVVIVSEAAARRFWPGRNPVGERLRNDGGQLVEVVGVARDTKVRTLGEAPRPYVYFPNTQTQRTTAYIVAATTGDPAPVLRQLNEIVSALDPQLGVMDSKVMSEHMQLMIWPARMGGILLALIGSVALALAATGLYGVVSMAAARRTREVGIRMALGAAPRDAVQLLLRDGMGLVLTGSALGVALALGLAQLIRRFLYGITGGDVTTFVLVPTLLIAITLIATWIPARRAARIHPVEALRQE